MSAEQTPSQPALLTLPIPDLVVAPLVSAHAVQGYRILFYMAVVVALAATAVAWNMNSRPAVQVPPTPEREKDYAYTIDAYGFKYQGHTGNVIDEYVLRYGAWEKDHLFFVRDYLKNLGEPNAVVIDVGSNTGHHTLFYSRHAARVLAFDPYPPVIVTFKQNMALNPHVKNVELFEVGLGDSNAELPFVAPVASNHGQGSFRVDTPENPEMKQFERKLRIVIGDDYLKDKNLGPVAFIKVDIEGFEESALKGLRQTIEKHRPMLEVEVSPPPVGTIDTYDRLKGLFPENYEFFVLPWTAEGAAQGKYQLQKLDWAVHSKGHQIELIACPKERLNALPGLGGGK
ncbi:MAG: hypothetical protein C0467_01635 [Planctomycetaceae bacterium]|nr:hypothetical protein [Planctomycetaceae bacterium]